MDRENTTLIYKHQTHTAHRLQDHKGKCKNLHGHTYTITMEFKAEPYNTSTYSGMVMDFADVKNIVGNWIDDMYDHAVVLERTDPLLEVLCKSGLDIKVYKYREAPTAENMARELLDDINSVLRSEGAYVQCVAVTVEESPGKAARCARRQ